MTRFVDESALEAHWRATHVRIFSGRRIDEGPFADPTWKLCLLAGGLRLEAADFIGLQALAEACGDVECLLLDPAMSFVGESAAVLRLDRDDWIAAHTSTALGHVGVHVVAASGQWGLVADPEGVAVLGAPNLALFLSAAGGADAVRARYEAEEPSIGFGVAGEEFRRRLRSLVGMEAT